MMIMFAVAGIWFVLALLVLFAEPVTDLLIWLATVVASVAFFAVFFIIEAAGATVVLNDIARSVAGGISLFALTGVLVFGTKSIVADFF